MIDPIFQSDGTYLLARKLLDAAALRQEAIASNMANVETPGYHRIDIAPDFAAQLKASCEGGAFPASAEALDPKLAEDPNARAIRPDGNNVEMEHELLAMNKNGIEYEYLTDVISTNIKQLKVAISGQVS